jgi:hypothetical protein
MSDDAIAVVENKQVDSFRKYESHVKPRLEEIAEWFREGICEYDMCQALDISQDTWIQYKKAIPELIEAVKKGRSRLIQGVVNKVVQKANGYEYDEKTVEYDDNGKEKVVKVVKKHYVPDTTAQIFFLTNMDPDNWKHKGDHQNIYIQNNTVDITQLKEQLKQTLEEYKNVELLETCSAVDVQPVEEF